MDLEFSVEKHILKRTDTSEEDLLNYNFNEYNCVFTFDAEGDWTGINKFVIFYDGWGNSSISHIGSEGNVYETLVPSTVLKGTYFKVSVYGGDLYTTNSVTIPLIQSGYSEIDEEYWTDEYQDIFVEIFDSLDDTVDSMVYDDKTLYLYHKDRLIDAIVLPFITQEECMSLANNVLNQYFFDLPVATQEHNGLFSSVDKIKLDNIQERANKTIVDTQLDYDSDNPISNRSVYDALSMKEDSYDFVERMDGLITDLINNGL